METLEQIALDLIEHRPLARTEIFLRLRAAVPRLPPDAYVLPWLALLEAGEI